MFKVTVYNLADDARNAKPSLGESPLGQIEASAVHSLLENFRQLDSMQNLEAEPEIRITARAGKFVVRANGGKLFLYDTREMTRGCTELTAGEIVAQLDRPPSGPDAPEEPVFVACPKRGLPCIGGLVMLAIGLTLNGYAIFLACHHEDAVPPLPLAPLASASEIAQTEESLSGVFATGSDEGDRTLIIATGGSIRMQRFGTRQAVIEETSDTYRLGRNDRKLFLSLAHGGAIAIENRNILSCFGDTYRRIR